LTLRDFRAEIKKRTNIDEWMDTDGRELCFLFVQFIRRREAMDRQGGEEVISFGNLILSIHHHHPPTLM
jgi:hypothetical protein